MMTELQRRQAYLQGTGDPPAHGEDTPPPRGPHESSPGSASRRHASSAKSVSACRSTLRLVSGAAVLSLAVSVAGLVIVSAAFALTKSAVTEFVRGHQDRKDVTFDLMCPNATNSVIGIVVGTFTYASLHFLVNCVTSQGGLGGGGGLSWSKWALAVTWILLDTCVTAGWSLILCLSFLPLFAHVAFSSRLQRGVMELDLNHYSTALVVMPNLVVAMETEDPIQPASFPTFRPALALFVGVGIVLAAQILHFSCLAVNLSHSQHRASLAKKRLFQGTKHGSSSSIITAPSGI